VWPQAGSDIVAMEGWDFANRLIQPMDPLGGNPAVRRANEQACIAVALSNPRWRLSLQTHKLLGLA
jgi:7-carboxy-7-deazaguanine synthase